MLAAAKQINGIPEECRITYSVADWPAGADRSDVRAVFLFLDTLTRKPARHFMSVGFKGKVPDVSDFKINPAEDVKSAVSGFSFCPMQPVTPVPGCPA